jgi:hypothetical protein
MPLKNINLDGVADLKKLIDNARYMVPESDIDDIWTVSLTTKKISIKELQDALNAMLEKIRENSDRDTTFYMWFDEMALQLRFNIIEGHAKKLPFGCNIKLVQSPDEILQEFLASGGSKEHLWEDILDDVDEKPFVLKVFVSYIACIRQL